MKIPGRAAILEVGLTVLAAHAEVQGTREKNSQRVAKTFSAFSWKFGALNFLAARLREIWRVVFFASALIGILARPKCFATRQLEICRELEKIWRTKFFGSASPENLAR